MASTSNRSEIVNFRVTPEEKAYLSEQAASTGMRLSDYARMRTIGDRTSQYSVLASTVSTFADEFDQRLAQLEQQVKRTMQKEQRE